MTNTIPPEARAAIDSRPPAEGIYFAYGWAQAAAAQDRPDARAALAEIGAVLTYAAARQTAALDAALVALNRPQADGGE